MPSSLYGEGRRELGLGDLLALYTDGVVETPNTIGEEFGSARLVEILTRHQDASLADLLARVIESVDRWSGGGPPHDDVTLVLARTDEAARRLLASRPGRLVGRGSSAAGAVGRPGRRTVPRQAPGAPRCFS